MRRQAMIVPNLDDGGRCNAHRLGHRAHGPVNCFLDRRLQCQRRYFIDQHRLERRNPGRPGFVAKQAVDPLDLLMAM